MSLTPTTLTVIPTLPLLQRAEVTVHHCGITSHILDCWLAPTPTSLQTHSVHCPGLLCTWFQSSPRANPGLLDFSSKS